MVAPCEQPPRDVLRPAQAAAGMQIARVLLDSMLPQLDHLFDYAIPANLSAAIRIGQRVRVPLRNSRNAYGYVVEFAAESEFGSKLQAITEIVSPVPLLPPGLYRLVRQLADRAGGSACDVVRLAIPKRYVGVEKQFLAGNLAVAAAAADAAGAGAGAAAEEAPAEEAAAEESGADNAGDAAAAVPRITAQQASAQQASASPAPDDITAQLAPHLLAGERLTYTPSHGVERLPTGEWVRGWAAQFARLAKHLRLAGSSVIIVTPDYRDEEQVLAALAAINCPDVVRADARQPGGERYAGYLRQLAPEPVVVVGNRAAVYAPVAGDAVLLMWDDGDPLLAERQTPYVHARDVALVREAQARNENTRLGLLFAAYSRSLEVERLVAMGHVQEQRELPRRTQIRHADAAITPDAFAGRLPEFVLRTMREALRFGPVLVQVAAAGFAPVAVCENCGERPSCEKCGGPLGFRRAHTPACRWCGEAYTAKHCALCGGGPLVPRGAGAGSTVTQFEKQFAKQFPGVRVLASDGEHTVQRVDARPALIVATRGAEPLAAGGYQAVILLDAPQMLAAETLRVGEDCLRWWENAAALAASSGVCVMASGAGPIVQAFCTGQLAAWRHKELHTRKQLRFPPMVRAASVTGGISEVTAALAAITELPGVDVLGPLAWDGSFGAADVAGREAALAAGVPLQRAIVRFDYAAGAEVAARLRGVLVAGAAGAQAQERLTGRRGRRLSPAALKLRFDDRGIFDL